MKIRHPFLFKLIGFLGSLFIRLWMRTLHYRYNIADPRIDIRYRRGTERYIYALWHEVMLFPVHLGTGLGVHILVSQHSDGEIITQIAERLGFRAIRGSTTRGGARAVLELLEMAERSHVAITPDGPRGPRRRVQGGLIYLASRSGRPIVPLGFAAVRGWRAASWDRFLLPRPYTTVFAVAGPPITISPDLDSATLEQYRQQVEHAMLECTDTAERAALHRRWPRDLGEPRGPHRAPHATFTPSTPADHPCQTPATPSKSPAPTSS